MRRQPGFSNLHEGWGGIGTVFTSEVLDKQVPVQILSMLLLAQHCVLSISHKPLPDRGTQDTAVPPQAAIYLTLP